MFSQMILTLGLGFSSSKSSTLPFASPACTLLFPDGVTLDILRALQGIGAAAAFPAAVRCIAFAAPHKHDLQTTPF